ncbi:MAG: hypothetical protein KA210_07560 [Bacteroidia bacterium]|nr:hypothetical protein [Bacteroidia bacterium]
MLKEFTWVIKKNEITFWGRILFVPALIWLMVISVQNLLNKESSVFQIILIFFFLFFLLFILISVLLSLLSKSITTKFNNHTSKFVTYSILKGENEYSISQLRGYSKTKLWTKFKDFPGIILYLEDDSKIELTEYNLQSLKPFLNFLNNNNVNFFGEEKSWFPFKSIHYQYDKKDTSTKFYNRNK